MMTQFLVKAYTYRQLLIFIIILLVSIIMSTQIIRPRRSMSYNDIKKRRMLRQSKSKGKLKSSQASTEIVQTEKKINPYVSSDIYDSERPDQIEQIKDIIEKKMQHSVNIRDTSRKAKRVQVANLTDRVETRNESNNIAEKSALLLSQSACTKPIQIVRELIEQSKSDRKLLKYTELRNKFKMSKSRSRSRSAKSLLQKSKVLVKKIAGLDLQPKKPENSPPKGIKNSHRIKKFESVRQTSWNNNHSKRYLVTVPKENIFFKKQSRKQPVRSSEMIESSIQLRKQSEVLNEQQQRLLRQMCPRPQKRNILQSAYENEEERILDLLDVQPSELNKYLGKKQRQKKLVSDLEKLSNKFPKGFFKIS